MPVRNPPWTRDELILALDLYFRHNPVHISKEHPAVVALSQLLNKPPIHTERPDAQRFRNPNGVYMKLCNFLRLDPSYTGTGLEAGSHGDEVVWNEYSNDISRLRAVAAAIQATVESAESEAVARGLAEDEDDQEASEGRVLARLHKVRERNRELVRKKKAKVLHQTGGLRCEVCDFDFHEQYGDLGEGFIECHYTKSLSSLRPGEKTKLADLALVCANCHRMLHRGRPWPTVDELRTMIVRIKLDQGATATPMNTRRYTVSEKNLEHLIGHGAWIGTTFKDHGKTMAITKIGRVYREGREKLVDVEAAEQTAQ